PEHHAAHRAVGLLRTPPARRLVRHLHKVLHGHSVRRYLLFTLPRCATACCLWYGVAGTKTTYDGLMADGGLDLGRAISLTRRLTFGFSTGVSGARTEGGDLHYVLTGHSTLSYEIGRSWTSSLSFHRGVDYSQGLGLPVIIDSVSAGVSGDLGRRVQVSAGGGFVSGNVGAGLSGAGGSSYKVATGNASVRTALTRTTGVSVHYAYRHYRFGDPAALPIGLRANADRHTVRASLDLWVPLITRARRPNASR